MIDRSVMRLKKYSPAGFLIPEKRREMMIDVTMACNQGCPTCFARHSNEHIQPALLNRLAEYVEKHMLSAVFLGGEPTLCLDLLMETAMAHPEVHFVLVTGGETLTPESVSRIFKAGNVYVVISLNGIGDINDLTRSPGSFSRVTNGIRLLREAGVSFGFNTVANKLNMKQLISGELAGFLDNAGACTWEILRYYPIGNHSTDYHKLMLTSEQLAQLKMYRSELSASNPYGFLFPIPEHDRRKCSRTFKIAIDGSITYCPFSIWSISRIGSGDSDETILSKFLLRNPEWLSLTKESPGFCPLYTNTAGFIRFHQQCGNLLCSPTGILDEESEIHRDFVKNFQQQSLLC